MAGDEDDSRRPHRGDARGTQRLRRAPGLLTPTLTLTLTLTLTFTPTPTLPLTLTLTL